MKKPVIWTGVFLLAAALLWASGIAPAAYNIIQNAGVALTGRSTLNFVNGGCVDNSGSNRTDCTIGGTLYSQTNSVTDAVQTTETSLVGTGSGSNVLNANFYAIGTALKVAASGFYSTTASPGTITVRLKHSGGATGTVTVAATAAIAPPASASNQAWRLTATITCRTTGTSGTLIVNTILEFATASAFTPADPSMVNTTTVTVDTTAAQTVDLTAAWSAASQSITATNIDMALPGGGSASNGVTFTIANAGSTGTTVNTLTKLTGAPSTALIAATTDTGGVVGITTSGAGTTGTATITISGQANCVFDGATTAGHYVQISSTVAGNCHDSASTYPTTGQVIGRVLSTNAAGGTFSLYLIPSEIKGGSGGGGGGVTLAQLGVSLASFTDPNAATWTWFNQASSTVSTVGASIVLSVPNSGGNNISGRTTPVVGSSTYTATLGLIGNLSRQDFGQCGLVITDGTNYELIRYPKDAGDLDIFTWTGTGTPNTNLFQLTNGGSAQFYSPYIFEQVQEDSTNRNWRFSSDGVNFTTLFTETKQTYVVATAAGFFCLNNTGASKWHVGMTAVHWLTSTP
jgi:hypothetical protein